MNDRIHNQVMLDQQFERGRQDAREGKAMIYGCHFGMTSSRDAWKHAYEAGHAHELRLLRKGRAS